MRLASTRSARPRRGLTLIEMLVTVALLVMIMVIVVSIFHSATSAITIQQTYFELDQNLRRLDATLRQDLRGATARFTPPLDPAKGLGYFEYSENWFADKQGEDTDDMLAFTVKAPEGHPFTGRVWIKQVNNQYNPIVQPVVVTSDFAEVVYFLRNGNLYRRVLLVAPERQSSLSQPTVGGGFLPLLFNQMPVSWQGMNDLSSRPSLNSSDRIPILNTLGDLTNRQNRYARPRFCPDFRRNSDGDPNSPDGLPDDFNNDGVPDYYPTLYPHVFLAKDSVTNNPLVNEPALTFPRFATFDTMPFPYIFPGMYSLSGTDPSTSGVGWMHTLDKSLATTNANNYNIYNNINVFNHAPLADGDNLPIPLPANYQTWWGFPTWRETMSFHWGDPIGSPVTNAGHVQSDGLSRDPTTGLAVHPLPPLGRVVNGVEQYAEFSDSTAGSPWFNSPAAFVPDPVWEDDLIMTNVRSFDVKAFDPAERGYFDLGYANGYFNQTHDTYVNGTPPQMYTSNNVVYPTLQTFAHEGRMPPLTTDNRPDEQWPLLSPNVGDDDPGVLRLRRVWDTWSTDYTRAPDMPLNPLDGPLNGKPPTYPSYPPPYPAALRGIQIQIRVNDVKAERIKVLTIQQDFTDKL